MIRINTFRFAASRQDFIGVRKGHVVEFGVDESPGSHNSLIGRIDETGERARQVDVLVGSQRQLVLFEPDGHLVGRAAGRAKLLQADRTGVDAEHGVGAIQVPGCHVDGLVPAALAVKAGHGATFCDAE